MSKRSPAIILLSLIFGVCLTQLSAQPLITATISSNVDPGSLSESCGAPYNLILTRGIANTESTEIFISEQGTATLGVDYSFPDGSFPATMAVDVDELIIPILVDNDGIPEGLETIEWEIASLAGVESDAITLSSSIIDEFMVEIQTVTDTIEWCLGLQYAISATSNALISWMPAEAFSPASGESVTVTPMVSGWYYASVGNDTCGATDSVYFDLSFGDAGPDTLFICSDGMGMTIPATITGDEISFSWTPADTTLSDPLILTPIANPAITSTYVLHTNFGFCATDDTIVVRVDSIPYDLHIDIAPLKAYYCAGEVIAAFSPLYDSLNFPDIRFNWLPAAGTYLTNEELLNVAIELQDTTTYIREMINNACRSMDSVMVNVVPAGVPISVSDTTLCPGAMFDVAILSTQVTEPEWTPEEGLSCVNCLNPKVTVIGAPGTTITYMFSGKVLECPVGASLQVHVPPVQAIGIAADQVVCIGQTTPLTINNPEDLTDIQWSIGSGNASLSCTNCLSPSVTINGQPPITINVSANTTNPDFCGASGTITLQSGVQPQITGEVFQACKGGNVTLNAGNSSYSNLQWSVFNGDLSLSCTDCPNPVVTVNGNGRIRLDADVPGADTCGIIVLFPIEPFSDDESNLMVVSPDPPIGQGSEVLVTLNVNASPPTNISWIVNGISVGGNSPMLAFNASEASNFVEVNFTNSHDCPQKDTLTVNTVPPFYKIPNAFTPNNDMMNDNFRIIITGNISLREFLVFNRWGQLVYEAPADDLEGWDGDFKGQPASSDTYVYSATLEFPDGKIEVAKGDVMLIR